MCYNGADREHTDAARATITPMVAETPERGSFLKEWNALPHPDRRRIRRLVRLGRPLAEPQEATLAVAYAQFQRSRIWARTFWLWFLPGLVVALSIASTIHPLIIGIVLALAGQAVWAHHNTRRASQINSTVLEP